MNGAWYSASNDCYASLPAGSLPQPDGNYLWACIDGSGSGGRFFLAPLTAAGAAAPPPPPDPAVLAQTAVNQMGLRSIGVGMAPPPGAGKVGVIGLPTWMWVADPGPSTTGPQTRTASERGYTVTATATLTDITWSMGDGGSVVCHGASTPYNSSYGRRPSPDCGYTYTKSGDYTVTATSHWQVAWEGIGQSGVIPLQFVSTEQVTQAELQAIGQR